VSLIAPEEEFCEGIGRAIRELDEEQASQSPVFQP